MCLTRPNLLVFSAGKFCVVRNSSSRNLWKNILQIWQQSRYSCKVRIGFSLFFPFTKTVIRYINKRTDSTISTKATLDRGGWIGVCKSADPLKLMAESVGPLKKSTKSESAITDPSRISAILFLVIFSTAWHRYIRKRKWAFPGDVEIHDPNFQTTKIQNPGP